MRCSRPVCVLGTDGRYGGKETIRVQASIVVGTAGCKRTGNFGEEGADGVDVQGHGERGLCGMDREGVCVGWACW